MMSRIVAFLILILLSPAFVVISIIIILDDGRPILFKQKRIGIGNSEFFIFKFRTMKKNMQDLPTHLLENPESFYTKIGPYLRKLSLDEIPQIINIIKGDMVFIGPRPALYNQYDLIELRTNKYIHKLIPGMTGWAQVSGRDDLSIYQKVSLDEYYLKNKSIMLDLKIVFLTFLRVFDMKGISH